MYRIAFFVRNVDYCYYYILLDSERERDRDRQTDRNRNRQTDGDRQRQRERERERDRDRDRERETEQRDRQRQTETETERLRQRQRQSSIFFYPQSKVDTSLTSPFSDSLLLYFLHANLQEHSSPFGISFQLTGCIFKYREAADERAASH